MRSGVEMGGGNYVTEYIKWCVRARVCVCLSVYTYVSYMRPNGWLDLDKVGTNIVGGGGGGAHFSEEKKSYKGERFNVISVTRGWVRVKFPEKSVT